jgi:hypothetical protein
MIPRKGHEWNVIQMVRFAKVELVRPPGGEKKKKGSG